MDKTQKLILENQKFIMRYLLSIKENLWESSLVEREISGDTITVDPTKISLDGDFTYDREKIESIEKKIDAQISEE